MRVEQDENVIAVVKTSFDGFALHHEHVMPTSRYVADQQGRGFPKVSARGQCLQIGVSAPVVLEPMKGPGKPSACEEKDNAG